MGFDEKFTSVMQLTHSADKSGDHRAKLTLIKAFANDVKRTVTWIASIRRRSLISIQINIWKGGF